MSGNPNPQHNPTDGLGVAAYVQVSGTNVVNNSGGAGSADGGIGTTSGAVQGQGIGACPSTNHPNAQYLLVLSLGSKTVNGVSYHSTCQLTTALVDVSDAPYTGLQNPTYKSYADPAAGSPAWYRPSVFSDSSSTSPAYNGSVASVSSSGLITALAVGEAIIEVQYPTFDFEGSTADPEPSQASGDPVMMIFVQVRVVVVN